MSNFSKLPSNTNLEGLLNEVLQELKAINRVPILKEPVIDSKTAMMLLGIDSRTLQNHRDTGYLPFTRMGGKILYRISDIDEILERNYVNVNRLSGKKLSNS